MIFNSVRSALLDHGHSRRHVRVALELGLGLVLGLAAFLLIYGRFPLYPSNVGWIYTNVGGTDPFQAQSGWEWLRREPWGFPFGTLDAYGYPWGTSITYTDSIALIAIPLRLFSRWLPATFQYLGLWNLASIIGQMLTGLLILGLFTRSYAYKCLGALLLVLSPPLIQRTFRHNSLSAQWILLAGILFVFLEYRQVLWRSAWIVLFAVGTLVHAYFAAMLVPLWAIGLYFHYGTRTRRSGLYVHVAAVIATVLALGYSTGMFSLGFGGAEASGFGYFSWNLNGFLNPLGSSSFFKALPLGTGGQSEGFSYLGLGNLLVLVCGLFVFLRRDTLRRKPQFFLPFGIVGGFLCLYALSQNAYVGATPLWHLQLAPPISAVTSIFRASGRFIWPVFYFVVLFGLVALGRNSRYATLILLLALPLQYLDLQPFIKAIQFHGFERYESPLQASFWSEAAKASAHVMLLPASYDVVWSYQPFAKYAWENGLTLNWGYFTRGRYDLMESYGKAAADELLSGRADQQTIYVLWEPGGIATSASTYPDTLRICQLDGYNVILSAENRAARGGSGPASACSKPSQYRLDMTYHAAVLPSQTGSVQGLSRVATAADAAGFLTYGPYTKLPAGRYAFDIAYAAQPNSRPTVGKWDVVSWRDGVPHALLEGQLASNATRVSGQFEIAGGYATIEIRTYFGGQGTLTVSRMAISRVH